MVCGGARPIRVDGVVGANPVLVVEDDLEIREALVSVLDDAGYQTAAAANGLEALRIVKTGLAPCLILLDQRMPVMDGRTFLKELRRDPALGRIPIVMITAEPIDPDARSAIAGHVSKPFSVLEVLDAVNEVCGPPGVRPRGAPLIGSA